MKKMFSIVFIVDCNGGTEEEDKIMSNTVSFLKKNFQAEITNRRIKNVFERWNKNERY
jgi:hypothetical protein